MSTTESSTLAVWAQPTAERPRAISTGNVSVTSGVLGLTVVVGLLVALYADLGRQLWDFWQLDPNYSHGPIVPVVSALLAWRIARTRGSVLPRQLDGLACATGLLRIAVGLGVHLAAVVLDSLLVDVVSLILVGRGLLLIAGGAELARAYRFPLWFLLFMAPLPTAWYLPLAVTLQNMVSQIATVVLQVVGFPALREGYLIHLPQYTIEVGQACSGLRQLTASLALSLAITHVSGRGWVFGLMMTAAAIPIAVLANVVRVVSRALALVVGGRAWAEGVFHTLDGLILVGVASVLLGLTAWGCAALEDYLVRRRAKPTAEVSLA